MVPTLFLKQGIGPVYLGLDQLGGILVIGVMLDTRNSIAIHSRSIEVFLQSFEIRINLVNL